MGSFATFLRMIFIAPFTGAVAAVVSALWMVPAAILAGALAGAWSPGPVAALDAAGRAGIEGLLGFLGAKATLPAWVAPASWTPVTAAALVWAFVAQRTAMRLAGLPRAPRGLSGMVRSLPEWLLLSVALPGAGVAVLLGGGLALGVMEFGWPFSIYDAPSVPERLAMPVAGTASLTLEGYAGPAILALAPVILIFAGGGRLMALQAANAGGILGRREGR
jgi:hypothetical protein